MDGNTKPTSSRWRATGWLRSMATYGRHTMRRVMISMYSGLTSALACFVLALILAPEVMTIRRRQSKTPAPDPRTRPAGIPIHDRGKFYLIQADGSRREVTPLFMSSQLKAYAECIGAAMVYEKTKLPD